MTPPAPEAVPISAPRKWAITFTVMVVAFMQILDTSVTNVILPHRQGSLSAGLAEVSCVLTSHLAANAVIIPAPGWLTGLFGRRRFFLICATLFVISSFISGAAPDLTTLIVARIFQGLGGGPIIPLSQAILWEIFPFHQRGLAMAVWGVGFILGPILGPTVGGYLADEWSWRWIFYINLPVGVVGFLLASAFLFDPPYLRKAGRVDWWGLGLMVAGSGIVTRIDQRWMLAFGCLLNAVSLYMMTSLTLGMDYWALALPRFLQGFAVGFIFVPLSTLALATIRREKLVNATAVYGMLRNVGGSIGIAVVTTLLAQRSQFHQATLVGHITPWDPETRAQLVKWAGHFAAQGSDTFTAQQRAVVMLYRDTVAQARLLAYADDFWLLAVMFTAVPLILPFMRRVRLGSRGAAGAQATERSPAPAVKENVL